MFYFFQNVFCPMERIAGIHAANTVSKRRVTDSMAVVCMAVQKGSNVTMVYILYPITNKRTNYGRCILHLYDAFIIKKNIEIFFTVFFPDIENYAISSSTNLPVTVGILVCACVLIIIGVVVTICVIR